MIYGVKSDSKFYLPFLILFIVLFLINFLLVEKNHIYFTVPPNEKERRNRKYYPKGERIKYLEKFDKIK